MYLQFAGALALDITLKSNGPAVLGSNITVEATVLGYDNESLKFSYWDDAQPQHRADVSLFIVLFKKKSQHSQYLGKYLSIF